MSDWLCNCECLVNMASGDITTEVKFLFGLWIWPWKDGDKYGFMGDTEVKF